MNWLYFAIFAAISFGLYNFFTKLAADRFSFSLLLMLTTGTSFLIAAITTIVLKINGHGFNFSKSSLIIPIAAGIFTGIAEIFYILMFQKNAPISIGNPLVVGGTTIIAVVLGIIILKEPLTSVKIIGIIFTLIGLAILSKN